MTDPTITRRSFLRTAALAAAALSTPTVKALSVDPFLFDISLAQWCLNKPLKAGTMDHLDFAPLAAKHGIHAVEYVNQFFMDKAKDPKYLGEMKKRATDNDVKSVLIMCDREGSLGAADEKERKQTVDNHKKWVEAAKFLGCHSIRVNGYSSVAWSQNPADFDESQKLVADGLHRLCAYGEQHNINVIIENHGGFSSNGKWLAGVIKKANHPGAGTLPDFGNFRLGKLKDGTTYSYDAYRGVEELMPFAKGVSVKTTVWDDHGKSLPLDYKRMIRIVLDAGYNGYCGIEHVDAGREWDAIDEVKIRLNGARDALLNDGYNRK